MIRPSKPHRRVIYLSIATLWISGAIFLIDRYLLGNLFSLFAPRSELQVTTMKVHGALAIPFIFVFGTIFAHFQRAWPLQKKRLSGLLLVSIFTVLCLTVWPLYYSSVDLIRIVTISVHVVLGLLIPGFVLLHILSKNR